MKKPPPPPDKTLKAKKDDSSKGTAGEKRTGWSLFRLIFTIITLIVAKHASQSQKSGT